jgi:DNA modification methylase
MRATILEGDVFDLLPTIPPGSVDAACYSPPYWALRSYLPRDHPLKSLELGSEPTPAEYVHNQIRVLRLVRECLADHGAVWVNIGDTYNNSQSGFAGTESAFGKGSRHDGAKHLGRRPRPSDTLSSGNLCLIPQRLAVAAQDDGWIVRSVICWRKPSAMPSSVAGWRWQRHRIKTGRRPVDWSKSPKGWDHGEGSHERERGNYRQEPQREATVAAWSDCPGCPKCEKTDGYVLRRGSWRPTSSWEPILMLAKSPRYFSDGEGVKTPAARPGDVQTFGKRSLVQGNFLPDDPCFRNGSEQNGRTVECAAGANARDVQSWSSEPLGCGICGNPACRWFTYTGDGCAVRDQKRHCPKCGAEMVFHYAAFPSALAEFCLRAATSAHGYCKSCGAPWVRVVETKFDHAAASEIRNRRTMPKHSEGEQRTINARKLNGDDLRSLSETKTTGWRPSCGCFPCEPRPGVVLDPFAGSGRAGRACQKLGLDFYGVELHPDFAAMARRLLAADAPLFDEVT